MKLYFSLLFLLALPSEGRAQQAKIDSLDRLIRQATTDTGRINLANEKINHFFATNLDSAISLAEKTLAQAQRVRYRKGEAHAHRQLAWAFAFKGEFAATAQNLHQAETLFQRLKDESGLCRVYGGYGMMYGMQSRYDSAIIYYQKAIALAQRIDNQPLLNNAYKNIAISYQMQSRYAQSLSYFQRALQFYEKQHDETSQATITLNMAITYDSMGDTTRAERLLLKAAILAKKVGAKNVEAYAYSNLASIYEGAKKHQQTYENALKAAVLGAEMGDIGIRAASLAKAALALAYQKKYRRAEALDRQAIAAGDSSRQPLNIYQAYANMGMILKLQDNCQAALPYLEKAYHTLQQTDKYDENASQFYLTLSECYEKTDNAGKALSVYKLSAAVADSIRNKENIRKATEMTMNDEFDKKQQIILTAQQRRNAVAQARQWALLTGLGLTLLLAAVIFYAYRNKQKANTLLGQQKLETEQTLVALQSAQDQLIQKEKMASLGELTAGIAHEIQNPLNFVNNFSEVNKELLAEMRLEIEKGNLDEIRLLAVDVEANEHKILEHGKRADNIVKGMLQHARPTTGEKQLTDLNALAEEYLRLAYHGLKAKDKDFNASLVTDFDSQLAPVKVVPQEIGRVLLNLFNNALYATQQQKSHLNGHYRPEVKVSTRKLAEKVIITVRDNGSGIPASVKSKIFQPFFTTKPTGQGTGLGLSLSYDIIKGHSGELRVESQEGNGAAFTIVLPTK